jgi:hypothetical protein
VGTIDRDEKKAVNQIEKKARKKKVKEKIEYDESHPIYEEMNKEIGKIKSNLKSM